MRFITICIAAFLSCSSPTLGETRLDGDLVDIKKDNYFEARDQKGDFAPQDCSAENRVDVDAAETVQSDLLYACKPMFRRACGLYRIDNPRAVVEVEIDAEGTPQSAFVAAAPNFCFVRQAAVAALKSRFVPPRQDGETRSLLVRFQRPADLNLTNYDPPVESAVKPGYRCPRGSRLTSQNLASRVGEGESPQPLLRCLPKYPFKCAHNVSGEEAVLLTFDVAENGLTENVRILGTTDPCYNKEAAIAVSASRYQKSSQGLKDQLNLMQFNVSN
ncbi:MAG: hypothetical protein AAGJ87_01490 [Pseudomonadota bacterium]